MNYIDIIFIIILIFSAIGGFSKGLVKEVVSLAAFILGIWGAIHFSYIATEVLTENFNFHSKHMNVISFGVTFIAIVILVHIVGNVLDNIVETAMLGIVNKLAGMVFGVVRSALFLSIVLLIFDKIDEDVKILPEGTKSESRMYEPIRNLAPSIFPFIDIWNEHESDEPVSEEKTA